MDLFMDWRPQGPRPDLEFPPGTAVPGKEPGKEPGKKSKIFWMISVL